MNAKVSSLISYNLKESQTDKGTSISSRATKSSVIKKGHYNKKRRREVHPLIPTHHQDISEVAKEQEVCSVLSTQES